LDRLKSIADSYIQLRLPRISFLQQVPLRIPMMLPGSGASLATDL